MMKRAPKRAFAPEPFSDDSSGDTPSKRVMEVRTADVRRMTEEPSHHTMVEPLAAGRANAARQHVLALNTQFASWVQSQLQNHADELWEEGVKDYLMHASHILDKFADIVEWLKVNGRKVAPTSEKCISEIVPPVSASSSPSRPSETPEKVVQAAVCQMPAFVGSSKGKTQPNDLSKRSIFATFSSPSLQNPGSSGAANEKPFSLFGNQSLSNASKVEPLIDIDEEEDEPPRPSSPSLQKVEEDGVIIVHEAKCKVYIKPDDPEVKGWKDNGVGHLFIKCKEGAQKASKESKPTIIIRNEAGKILLNASIYSGIKTNIQRNTVAAIFHILDGHQQSDADMTIVAKTYLLRLKSEDDAKKLAAAITDSAPSS